MNAQKQYYSIFIVNHNWPDDLSVISSFLCYFLQALSINGRVEGRCTFTNGDQTEFELRPLDGCKVLSYMTSSDATESILVSVKGRPGPMFRFFFYMQCRMMEEIPDYVQFLSSQVQPRRENPAGLRFLSFSVPLDSWRPLWARHPSAVTEFHAKLDRLFADSNGVYGYGDETVSVISSPFCFIRGNDPAANYQIVDFDYQNHIEQVYEYNLLSPSHLRTVGGDPIADFRAGAETVQEIYGSDGQFHGLAVWGRSLEQRKRLQASSISTLLAPEKQSGPEASILLLDRNHVAQLGTAEQIAALYPAREIRLLPDGFAQIIERIPATYEHSCRRVEGLQRLYWPLLRNSNQQVFVHEFLDHFVSLKNASAIIYRLPGGRIGSRRPVKIRLTASLLLERLQIALLMENGTAGKILGRASSLLQAWTAHVGLAPESYGTLSVKAEPQVRQAGDKRMVAMVIDGRRLEQEAINLLVLMVDEFDAGACLVSFLVLGDMKEPKK